MRVRDYISDQEAGFQSVLRALRHLIVQASPKIQENYKYNVPFYSYYRGFCYLNVTRTHVVLGLCYGTQLSNASGILTGTGKQVRHVCITSMQDLPLNAIREILQEALIVNELHEKQKKVKKQLV